MARVPFINTVFLLALPGQSRQPSGFPLRGGGGSHHGQLSRRLDAGVRVLLGSLWWLVGAAALVLLAAGSSSSLAAHHTLHYFFTGVSEPGHGLPQFTIVGYLDDQQFVRYDSDARRDMPRSPWIRKVELEDPQYWDWQTQLSHSWELYFRVSLWGRSNHSRGFHTWQWMHGCELGQDGRKGGLSQFGYDGKDFLSLDKETLTWTAADSRAQLTKRRWEADPVWTAGRKNFLEGDCIEWLHKYLSYGKETLLRTESPVVTVTRKVSYGGLETLTCRAHGFYPKQIDATWRKDGEVLETETYRGGVSPNMDGTYYTWLSIEVDPEKRGLYQCHVEHDGLSEPLDVTWKAPDSTGFLAGCISGGLAAIVLLVVTAIFCIRKQQEGYRSAPKISLSHPGADWVEGIPSFPLTELATATWKEGSGTALVPQRN